jgi:hypothetical protein
VENRSHDNARKQVGGDFMRRMFPASRFAEKTLISASIMLGRPSESMPKLLAVHDVKEFQDGLTCGQGTCFVTPCGWKMPLGKVRTWN